MYRYIYVLILISTLCYTGLAQQNTTLYYMHKIPQSNLLNPAIQNGCKYYFSGILIPIAGQVLPPLYFNYNNNFLSINQLIRPGTGTLSDSLIWDIPYAHSKLRKVNYISLEQHIDWFSAGYRWKNWYFTFNLSEKMNLHASFPKDLLTLIWEGNGQSLIGKNALLGFLGAGVNWYREYAFGASTPLNNKWTVGGRMKILFGKENLWFKNNNLTFKTDEDDFSMTVNSDWEVYSSQQFYDVTQLEVNYERDSLMFAADTLIDFDNFSGKDVKKIIFEKRNPGVAIDMGFSYVFNNKITAYGSLLDIGFIRYKNNPNGAKSKGEFYFDGWNIQPYFNENDSVQDAYEDYFKDSVIRVFEPSLIENAYSYWLTPKLYLGGTYKINEKLNAGILFRGDVFIKRLHGSLTLSANANIKKWFSPTLSYTIINNSFKQVGAGVLFKIPWFQFYIVTDNVCAIIWPEAARNVNFRMGINLLFGCDKKSSATLIE